MMNGKRRKLVKSKKKRNINIIHWMRQDSKQAVLMLAPMLIGFVLFTYVPILYILRYAFYDSNGFVESFTGLDNFIRLFARDKSYWSSGYTY